MKNLASSYSILYRYITTIWQQFQFGKSYKNPQLAKCIAMPYYILQAWVYFHTVLKTTNLKPPKNIAKYLTHP